MSGTLSSVVPLFAGLSVDATMPELLQSLLEDTPDDIIEDDRLQGRTSHSSAPATTSTREQLPVGAGLLTLLAAPRLLNTTVPLPSDVDTSEDQPFIGTAESDDPALPADNADLGSVLDTGDDDSAVDPFLLSLQVVTAPPALQSAFTSDLEKTGTGQSQAQKQPSPLSLLQSRFPHLAVVSNDTAKTPLEPLAFAALVTALPPRSSTASAPWSSAIPRSHPRESSLPALSMMEPGDLLGPADVALGLGSPAFKAVTQPLTGADRTPAATPSVAAQTLATATLNGVSSRRDGSLPSDGRLESLTTEGHTPRLSPEFPGNAPFAGPTVTYQFAAAPPTAREVLRPANVTQAELPEPSHPVPSNPQRLTLQLQTTEEKVQVQLVERSGHLHVAVRTSDPDLTDGLRQDLSQLVSRLEKTGYQAETWTPEPLVSPTIPAEHSQPNDQPGSPPQHQRETAQDQTGQEKRHRPVWTDAFNDNLQGLLAGLAQKQ